MTVPVRHLTIAWKGQCELRFGLLIRSHAAADVTSNGPLEASSKTLETGLKWPNLSADNNLRTLQRNLCSCAPVVPVYASLSFRRQGGCGKFEDVAVYAIMSSDRPQPAS